MRVCSTIALIVASVVAAPSDAFGQTIAGSVTDSSGAALPGVFVQVESTALIEKTRTAVTDGNGRYRIEDLRPGVYTVTFVRDGFDPQVREGVEVTSAFASSVNGQLAPGSLTETITVTGDTSAVDIHSATAATTLRGEVVKSLPTFRTYNALVVLVPGAVTSANDVVTGTSAVSLVGSLESVVSRQSKVGSQSAVRSRWSVHSLESAESRSPVMTLDCRLSTDH